MSKSAMPVSKAKTAYGLLSEIRKLILEEPKRYDQTNWLTRNAEGSEYYADFAPTCGTVGCVGGWTEALHPGDAGLTLGITNDQQCELFDGDKAGRRYGRFYQVTANTIRAHAKRGAAHIAKFQKKYAKQLKAKRV